MIVKCRMTAQFWSDLNHSKYKHVLGSVMDGVMVLDEQFDINDDSVVLTLESQKFDTDDMIPQYTLRVTFDNENYHTQWKNVGPWIE